MPILSPHTAAQLADEVYAVQDERRAKLFMMRPEFADKSAVPVKAEVGFRLIFNVKDGFAVCAKGAGQYKNDLFLIFRGSTGANNNADWMSNGRIGTEFSRTGLLVHVGFNHIFTSMLTTIKEFMSKNAQATGTVHCIGHSLGGAVATLCSDWVKSNRGGSVALYTFGAPRPGFFLFARKLKNRLQDDLYRVYKATDPVPMIPMFPFVQPPLPGFGHYIPSQEAICSAEAHDISQYAESVRDSKWSDLERRSPPYNVESLVEEWLRSKSPVNPNDAKVWQWINSAIIYVLKKISMPLFLSIQSGAIGAITIADKIAWILRKGIELSKDIGTWVILLMRKIMQALGMAVAKSAEHLTRNLMRHILIMLTERVSGEARKAVRKNLDN